LSDQRLPRVQLPGADPALDRQGRQHRVGRQAFGDAEEAAWTDGQRNGRLGESRTIAARVLAGRALVRLGQVARTTQGDVQMAIVAQNERLGGRRAPRCPRDLERPGCCRPLPARFIELAVDHRPGIDFRHLQRGGFRLADLGRSATPAQNGAQHRKQNEALRQALHRSSPSRWPRRDSFRPLRRGRR